LTVFIITHSAPIVKGFFKLFLFFILKPYSSVVWARTVACSLSVPLTLIIIPLFHKKSRGNVAQNESKNFVQIAGAPGRKKGKGITYKK
jgi:hypothetical protein